MPDNSTETAGVTYIKTVEGREHFNVNGHTVVLPSKKVAVAKDLIRLHPFKLTFAAHAAFGTESTNSLTKLTNRMNNNVAMKEDEAERVIQAYRNIAEEILKITK
jgi:hypothetical protein